MPESPEVQVLAEVLHDTLAGGRIAAVDVVEARAVKTRGRPPESLIGATIASVRRHGKHLELATSGGRLIVSLGRHGWVRTAESERDSASAAVSAAAAVSDAAPAAPPALVRIDLAGSGAARAVEITDAGGWVSIGVFVVDEAADVPAIAALGPDPLSEDFPADLVASVLRGRRKRVKALLIDQAVVAGIGNAYSDEILFAARIAPLAQGADLDDAALRSLAAVVPETVRAAVDARRGIPIDALKAAKIAAMHVHGRTGEPCPGCGGEVEDVPGSKGAAQYCPTCQTAGGRP